MLVNEFFVNFNKCLKLVRTACKHLQQFFCFRYVSSGHQTDNQQNTKKQRLGHRHCDTEIKKEQLVISVVLLTQ